MELFFEILFAACAVFGLWCAMQLALQALVGSPYLTIAVRLTDAEAAQQLWVLLEQAQAMLSYRRRMHIVVLYDRSLLENGRVSPGQEAIMRHFGAVCHVVDGKSEANDGREIV